MNRHPYRLLHLCVCVLYLAVAPWPTTAQTPSDLWRVYLEAAKKAVEEKRYAAAEAFALSSFKEAERLAAVRNTKGDDPRVVISRFLLIRVLLDEEKKDEARKYGGGSIRVDLKDIRELGHDLMSVVKTVHGLANLYFELGRNADAKNSAAEADAAKKATREEADLNYGVAERLFLIEWATKQQVLGAEHLDTVNTLSDLALAYYRDAQYDKAIERFEEAFESWDSQVKSAVKLCENSFRFTRAEPALPCSDIQWREVGSLPEVLTILSRIYYGRKEYDKVEDAQKKTISIWEARLGPDHSYTSFARIRLAMLYADQNAKLKSYDFGPQRDQLAERLFQMGLEVQEKVMGKNHGSLVSILESYATLLEHMNRAADAARMRTRIGEIRARKP